MPSCSISHQVHHYIFREYRASIYLVWPNQYLDLPNRVVLEITHPSRAPHTLRVESCYGSIEHALCVGRCLFREFVRIEDSKAKVSNTVVTYKPR